jgi:small-conductance mechanosensitive channel
LNDRRLQLELDNKEQIDQIQKLKTEVSHLVESRDREALKLRDTIESETKRLNDKIEEETARLNAVVEKENRRIIEAKASAEKQETQLAKLKSDIDLNKKELADGDTKLTALKTEISTHLRTQEEAKKVAEKIRITQDEVDELLLAIRSKFEETKGKLQRDEQKHLEEMKLETTRKVAVLEQQLVEELLNKKDRLAREIGLMLETHVKQNPEMTNKSLRAFQEQLDRLMDTQIATLSKHPGAIEKQKTLVELKTREKWKAQFVGLCVGLVVAVCGQHAYKIVKSDASPIQRRVTAVQDERKADLEKRKFNPTQTKELRGSYADSVIYTEDFVRKYQDEAFRKKLLSEAAPYMLKTWRIDEEKTIQLLASTSALVNVLKERRDAIHPDYIPQGIEKMKEAETEANLKLRQLLGSQVRFESYKKFERKFYEDNAR